MRRRSFFKRCREYILPSYRVDDTKAFNNILEFYKSILSTPLDKLNGFITHHYPAVDQPRNYAENISSNPWDHVQMR